MAQTVKNLLAMKETWVQSLGQEYPLEKGMATHSSMWQGRGAGLQSHRHQAAEWTEVSRAADEPGPGLERRERC